MGLEGLGEWIKDTINRFADYLKPWVLVDAFEEAVILRLGKYHRVLKPGLHPKFPVAEYALTALVQPDTFETKPVEVTTKDGKTVSIAAVIEFYVDDSRKFLVDHNDSMTNMKDIARGQISNYLEDYDWIEIKKKTTKNAIKKSIATKFLVMGVVVTDLEFTSKCEIMSVKIFGEGINAI